MLVADPGSIAARSTLGWLMERFQRSASRLDPRQSVKSALIRVTFVGPPRVDAAKWGAMNGGVRGGSCRSFAVRLVRSDGTVGNSPKMFCS